jgi:hypothetical protein
MKDRCNENEKTKEKKQYEQGSGREGERNLKDDNLKLRSVSMRIAAAKLREVSPG